MKSPDCQKAWDDILSGKTKPPLYIKQLAVGILGIMEEQDRQSKEWQKRHAAKHSKKKK